MFDCDSIIKQTGGCSFQNKGMREQNENHFLLLKIS